MKATFLKQFILGVIAMACFLHEVRSQTSSDPFVTTLNAAWTAKNYAAIGTAIEAELQQRPNDITVLYAACNYYVMIRPDVAKLVDAANRIKNIADASNKPAIKAVSEDLQERLPAIIQEGVMQPSQSVLDQLHVTFSDEFPGISRGSRLQASLQN